MDSNGREKREKKEKKRSGKTYLLIRFRQCVQNYFLIVTSDWCCCGCCCCAHKSNSIKENRKFYAAKCIEKINGSKQKPHLILIGMKGNGDGKCVLDEKEYAKKVKQPKRI